MVDWNNALSGAGVGGGIGSVFGPIGTGIGALGGGVLGLLGGGRDKPKKIKQLQNYTPEQQQQLDRLLQMAKEGNEDAFKYIQSILSDEEGAFDAFEAPAIEQFQEQTVPSILERFNRGGGMSKGSSAVNYSLGQAGRGLSRDLASQRANLKQNAMTQLNQMTSPAYGQRTTNYTTGGQQGAFGMLAPAAAQGYSSLLNSNQQNQSGGFGQQFTNLMNQFRGGI